LAPPTWEEKVLLFLERRPKSLVLILEASDDGQPRVLEQNGDGDGQMLSLTHADEPIGDDGHSMKRSLLLEPSDGVQHLALVLALKLNGDEQPSAQFVAGSASPFLQ
jgi:hypothetical protein